MPRVRKGAASRQGKKRLLKSVSGFRDGRGKLIKAARGAIVRAQVYARVGRKLRKREFRSMWIIRLNAACRERGLRYSQFISALKKANIQLNRKMLSEVAIADPSGFDVIVEKAKAVLGQK